MSKNSKPILFIFSGLPGSGKTTLSQKLARYLKACYLRIDTVEQALRDLCSFQVRGEGYRLAYRVAADNLNLGVDVIADSCNPIELTRREWENVAIDAKASFVNIEVTCGDRTEHQSRIETRRTNISGLVLPTWTQVEAREYHPWTQDRIVIDTALQTPQESFAELLGKIGVTGSQ